ncbi:hypothetical protein HYH02_009241 [Chlamydomonas schloesseri]|uniref:Protein DETOXIFICATION n=1 Tax=Chlamydomonas schloesseri TaxID=2026947 RepID=A0A835WB17_9CHLO|nr:hypothetical protein HYH02_009241 [Chlamydomonas schloesseri]|eukprot:KAG2444043.1 hypothetical protein HYH02_009241 [Chlamydomonas schloesseri]
MLSSSTCLCRKQAHVRLPEAGTRCARQPGLGCPSVATSTRRPHVAHSQSVVPGTRAKVVAASSAAPAGAIAYPGGRPGPLEWLRQRLSSPYDTEIFTVATPAFAGLALEPVVSAFNAGLVGHLGTLQLSAVSLGTTALNSFTFLFSFLIFLTVPDIAAAAGKGDEDEVSRVVCRSVWVALACGLTVSAAVFCNAATIVNALHPPEPTVAALATTYMQVRSLGIPAALLGFVATGVFRGFKDTRTPLFGVATSVAVSFGLHVLLLNVLHLDVWGAAAASLAASLCSCGVMMGLIARTGRVRRRHLLTPPAWADVSPLLQRGAVLSFKNMVAFGMILFASTLCVRMGAAFQASFEVIRQLWMLSMPMFECFNVATQSLCAAALGREDRDTARALLGRLLTLGMGVGAVVGLLVWAAHGPLIAFFTSDPAVVAHVMVSLPLICIFFPIDAAGSILDGSLLAAKQSNYTAAVQIVGSVVQYGLLMYVAAGSGGHVTTLSIWVAIKVMSFVRFGGGALRNYASPKSAYAPLPPAPPTEDEAEGEAEGPGAGPAAATAPAVVETAATATATAASSASRASVSDGEEGAAALAAAAVEEAAAEEEGNKQQGQQQGQEGRRALLPQPATVGAGVAATTAAAAAVAAAAAAATIATSAAPGAAG